jgi:hypothetical protein
MKGFAFLLGGVAALSSFVPVAHADTFNGAGDNQRDDLGYYYAITGGKFPTGNTPNGDNGSGGTFRYLTDETYWGPSLGTWHKDDWFAQNAGLAVTLKNGVTTVYDNNGIEDGTYGNYYNAQASGTANANTPGLYRAYSMSNNWDWIYAGYLKLEQATTITEIIAYFDENSGFDRNNPAIAYDMNIFSDTTGDLPANTGGFRGDVFSSKITPGTFSTSTTGVNRVFADGTTDPIFRLTYTLDAPITLQAGEYWFSHDAEIAPVPLPSAAVTSLGLLAGFGLLARRTKRAAIA